MQDDTHPTLSFRGVAPSSFEIQSESMANNDINNSREPSDPNARINITDEDRNKANKWFVRARELGDKRQFDYAVEYYVNGLEFWPDAIDDGCKPLHGCAVARKQTGGKKPGFKDTMKRSLNDKDPKQAFINALWLFGHDPDNINYIEGIIKNAGRLRAEDAAKWGGGVFLKSLDSSPKAGSKLFQSLAKLMEELGDRAGQRNETSFGVEAYQTGVEALRIWCRRSPQDQVADKAMRTLSTKLTILKGKYQDSDSYRESIVDTEEQRDLHDLDRSVQSDERMDQLVAKAEQAYRENPDTAGTLKNLVDLLCRREQTAEETRAIDLLLNEYKRSDNYRWKLLADDIRMKQFGREVREASKTGNARRAGTREKQIAQLRFELAVFKERVLQYPTDQRLKFELAVRNFRAGRFDEAIPLFQGARSDPRNRSACGFYLGRCFFRKGYHSQAISTFEETLRDHPYSDDELAKSMLYWLGRAQESGGDSTAASKSYGNILKMDYNYKDTRSRLDSMPDTG